MKFRLIPSAVLSGVLSLGMLFTGSVSAQTPAKAPATTPAPAKAAPAAKGKSASAVSADEIAAAQKNGMVWVNTDSKVYHKDGQFYGKTKQGKFMTEADAIKSGAHAAKASAVGKKKAK